jgi:alginate O-acetyltransferase complex protein AlgI
MVFSSLLFLFLFLPATLAAYYLAPHRFRNAVLLVASLAFYAWGAPRFVLVLVGGTWLDWQFSRAIYAAPKGTPARKRWLVTALVLNLALLVWFKYANFAVEEFHAVAHALGLASFPWANVALPIGISFITFHKISYLVDVYNGVSEPAGSFDICLLYIVLFPQLIAGPIVRYHDVDTQLVAREHTLERFVSGLCRFSLGMAKKVLVADVIARTADAVFGAPIASVSTGIAWLGVVAYGFQLYFDFSGYSDMAIGLGRMFGIEFLENFDRPFSSRDFTECWQHWHISLSRFMREYLYIPLGGSRVPPWRRFLNLWIVFLLSGLWHGASWTFIAWGAYQGFFLSIDKLFWHRIAVKLPRLVTVPITFFLMLLGWAFFRSETISGAFGLLHRLLIPSASEPGVMPLMLARVMDQRGLAMLILAAAICFTPGIPQPARWLDPASGERHTLRQLAPATALGLVMLVFCIFALANSSSNPFIYFRF